MSNINETGYKTSGIVSTGRKDTFHDSKDELLKDIASDYYKKDILRYIPKSITVEDYNGISETHLLSSVTTYVRRNPKDMDDLKETYIVNYTSNNGSALLSLLRLEVRDDVTYPSSKSVSAIRKHDMEIYRFKDSNDVTSLFENLTCEDITKYAKLATRVIGCDMTCIYSDSTNRLGLGVYSYEKGIYLKKDDDLQDTDPYTKFKLKIFNFDYSISHVSFPLDVLLEIYIRYKDSGLGSVYNYYLEDISNVEDNEPTKVGMSLESYHTTEVLRDYVEFDIKLDTKDNIDKFNNNPKIPGYGLQNFTSNLSISWSTAGNGLDGILPRGSLFRIYLKDYTTDEVTLSNSTMLYFYPVYKKVDSKYNILRSYLIRSLDPYNNPILRSYKGYNNNISIEEEEQIELVLQECRLRSDRGDPKIGKPMYVLSCYNYVVEHHVGKNSVRTVKKVRLIRGYSLFLSEYDMHRYNNDCNLASILLGNENSLRNIPVIIWSKCSQSTIKLLKGLDIPSTEQVGICSYTYRGKDEVEFTSSLRDNWVLDDLKRKINLLAFGVEDPYSIKKFVNGKPDYTIAYSMSELLNWRAFSDRL